MKFKKSLTVFSTVFLILLIGSPTTTLATNVPVNLVAGDEFTFTIKDLIYTSKVNGTEYANPADDVSKGDVIDVDVTGLTDEGSSNTYVNYTADNAGTTQTGSALVDAWEDYYFVLFFLLIFSGDWANTLDFSEPILEEDDDEVGTLDGLPVFANNNKSHYDKIIADAEAEFSEVSVVVGENVTKIETSGSVDDTKREFKQRLFYQIVEVGTNDNGDRAEIGFTLELDITIDYSRSILTNFLFDFIVEAEIGTASMYNQIRVNFVEGIVEEEGGLLDSLPFSPVYLSILAIAIPAFLVRRKKQI